MRCPTFGLSFVRASHHPRAGASTVGEPSSFPGTSSSCGLESELDVPSQRRLSRFEIRFDSAFMLTPAKLNSNLKGLDFLVFEVNAHALSCMHLCKYQGTVPPGPRVGLQSSVSTPTCALVRRAVWLVIVDCPVAAHHESDAKSVSRWQLRPAPTLGWVARPRAEGGVGSARRRVPRAPR